jgi:hypothetical protein
MTRHHTVRRPNARPGSALAAAIRRDDWELAALLLLDAIAAVARTMPPGTVDDVLALLSDTEDADDPAR